MAEQKGESERGESVRVTWKKQLEQICTALLDEAVQTSNDAEPHGDVRGVLETFGVALALLDRVDGKPSDVDAAAQPVSPAAASATEMAIADLESLRRPS